MPSRLYADPKMPLSGLRVSIKDNMDLAGIRTTLMNRAFAETYGAQDNSAHFVAKLIAQGVHVVGKTKLSAFASAEEPTDQWIDYHCPINPRGDEYQSPSGSTTGGATSLAGYPWLDFSVGTDSMLLHAFGTFANRASHGEHQSPCIVLRVVRTPGVGWPNPHGRNSYPLRVSVTH